eukprot:TRINITY_DN15275_c0_g1_i1.p1 TRINITY_DN15275_c0_g1~~TRINITY_DN15275_c0_g1_i1.p1  ORF type:complete len:563 (+),score=168.69 TRINITY_DN15275_c0_g1_i1:89-1777(+)
MDIERINSTATKATETLARLWDEVGFPASVRARHFVELSEQLETVFNTLVDNETRVRDEYRNNVLSLQNETEKIERALAIPHVQPDKNSSLMTLFDAYNKRCEEVKSMRNARLSDLNLLKERLTNLQQNLGEGIEFTWEEDNIGEEVVIALRKQINNAEGEQTQREIKINEIVSSMDAVCVDLDEPRDKWVAHNDLSLATIGTLEARLEELRDFHRCRQVEVNNRLVAIKELWEKLNVHEDQRNIILSQTGLSRATLHLLDSEYKRLLELKAANLKSLIATAEAEIEKLWNELSVTEDDRNIARQTYAKDYTEEGYAVRECVIRELEKKASLARPIVKMIRDRQSWLDKKSELEGAVSSFLTGKKKSSRDLQAAVSQQEKMKKELPALETNLIHALEDWENLHNEPFFYNGVNMLSVLKPDSVHKAVAAPRPVPMATPNKLAPTKSMVTPAKPNPAKTPSKAAVPTARAPVTPSTVSATPRRSIATQTRAVPPTPTTELSKRLENATISTPKHKSPSAKKRPNPVTKTPDAKRAKHNPANVLSPTTNITVGEAKLAMDREEF